MASEEAKSSSCVADDEANGVSQMDLAEFLKGFGLNSEIKNALLGESITDVQSLLECDMDDIVCLSKKFDNFGQITMQDKLKFRRTMKQLIAVYETRSKKQDSNNKNKTNENKKKHNNSNERLGLIFSNKEHSLLNNIYGKVDDIEYNINKMKQNIKLTDLMYGYNVELINCQFDEIIKAIKERKKNVLKEFEQIIENEKEEYNNIILKLKNCNLIINEEMKQFECKWLNNNNNNNDNSHNNNSNGINLRDFVKNGSKLSTQRQKELQKTINIIKEFEKENGLNNHETFELSSIGLTPSNIDNYKEMISEMGCLKLRDDDDGDSSMTLNKVIPLSDDDDEALIFEYSGFRVSRYNENESKWLKRGQGSMKLYYNVESNIIRMQFDDFDWKRVRISQTFYPFSDYNFNININRDNNCVFWDNTDYCFPSKPVTSEWRISFVNKKNENENEKDIGNDNKEMKQKLNHFYQIIDSFCSGKGLPNIINWPLDSELNDNCNDADCDDSNCDCNSCIDSSDNKSDAKNNDTGSVNEDINGSDSA